MASNFGKWAFYSLAPTKWAFYSVAHIIEPVSNLPIGLFFDFEKPNYYSSDIVSMPFTHIRDPRAA